MDLIKQGKEGKYNCILIFETNVVLKLVIEDELNNNLESVFGAEYITFSDYSTC